MRRFAQYRLLERRTKRGVPRPSQWLPKGAKRFALQMANGVLLVEWRPWKGYHALSLHRPRPGGGEDVVTFLGVESVKVKRRQLGLGDGEKLPALSGESVTLKKFPRIREFLTAIYYDDGAPRATGSLWLKADALAFVLTLSDPDACARLTARAASLDDVFALLEQLLGADAAPWELDRYAQERAQKKQKKK